MSVEATLYAALKHLAGGHVYRDIAPPDKAGVYPRVTFQQISGRPVNFLEGGKPSKKNARFQFNAWDLRRDDAMALMRQVEDTLRTVSTLAPTVLTAATALHESGIGPNGVDVYGAMQDFSFWYDD